MMKDRLASIIESLACTCWISNREWTWKVPLWPGRWDDEHGPADPKHSVGSIAFDLESRILCHRWLDWIWSPAEDAES